MTRGWIGVGLLAGSWLLGLDYFQPAHLAAWFAATALAVVFLASSPLCWPGRRPLAASLVLLAPAIVLMPLPYKAIPILLAGAAAVRLAPAARQWPRRLADGAGCAGAILLVQAITLLAYSALTARRHELPAPLNELPAVILRGMGVDAAASGGWTALRGVDDLVRIGSTWELLLDPATVCFFTGGLVLLGFFTWADRPGGRRRGAWLRGSAALLAATLAWAPLRAALLMAVYLQRALRADAWAEPNTAYVFVNSWLHILLLSGPVLLAVRFVGRRRAPAGSSPPAEAEEATAPSAGLAATAPLMLGLGVAFLAALLGWDPVGQRKAGRVMVVERHSTWEPTTEPYGTTVYGEAGSYNYAAAFAYCQQYYEMSRLLESQPIDDKSLASCDVLIIKTPTARYSEEEAAAVVRFVRRGGALLLIGDHTNVFNMNTYLNDIARRLGFTFRNDLLFRVGSPYEQKYRPPLAAHPIVQHVGPMNFAVSCSIDPGCSPGRMIIRSTGLWSLPPAYQESNYHPQAEYRPNMQYGAWCQMWSARCGEGRVLAFADSTLFSNFCTFQPGKAELLRGMVEWLNRRSVFDRPATRLCLAGPWAAAGLLLFGLGLWRRRPGSWILLLSAGLAGWAAAALAVTAMNRWSMPIPPVLRPMTHVVIDRNVSDVPLFTGAFADDPDGLGYGMFEQWIPRVGNFLSRETGEETWSGDGLVIICPTRSVPSSYRERLEQYVRSGGRVLVVDSIDLEGSTANSLLWPFGMASLHNAAPSSAEGALRTDFDGPEVALDASCEITGGQPLAWLGETPVAAQVRYGEGVVTAIGFGSLFSDANMGYHWMPEPDADTRARYEVLYGLLRSALPQRPR